MARKRLLDGTWLDGAGVLYNAAACGAGPAARGVSPGAAPGTGPARRGRARVSCGMLRRGSGAGTSPGAVRC